MAIEIVDLPIYPLKMVDLPVRYVNVYQRVYHDDGPWNFDSTRSVVTGASAAEAAKNTWHPGHGDTQVWPPVH